MKELGVGRPASSPSSLVEPQAEVDVAKDPGEVLFVEASDEIECLATHSHTGPTDGGWALGQHQSPEVAGRKIVEMQPMGISDGSPNSDDDACMLNGVVRVEELRPNCADARVLQHPNHFFQP